MRMHTQTHTKKGDSRSDTVFVYDLMYPIFNNNKNLIQAKKQKSTPMLKKENSQ